MSRASQAACPCCSSLCERCGGGRRPENRTRTSYDEIGGVEGALARRAETIFAELTENGANAQMEKDFQRLFTRLVTPGEGQEDTRRVVERRELGDTVWSLAQRLAGEGNRLVVTNAPALPRDRRGGARGADPPLAEAGGLDQPGPGLPVLAAADQVDHGSVVGRPDRRGTAVCAAACLHRPQIGLPAGATISARRSGPTSRRASGCVSGRKIRRRRRAEAENSRQQELAEAAVKLAAEQRRRARMAMVGGIVALMLAVFGVGMGAVAYQKGVEATQEAARANEQAEAAEAAEKVAVEQTTRARESATTARIQVLADASAPNGRGGNVVG